ncbi:MAG: O-antigen ligase family protein [Polyangiaceae bacterium]
MALVGTMLVVLVVLVRPQEFIPAFQSFSLLNAVTVLAVVGIAIESALGQQKLYWTPQMPWLLGFAGWCVLVTVRRMGVDGFQVVGETVGLSTLFMLIVASAGATVSRWRALAATLVILGTLIALTCIDQARRPAECIAINTSGLGGDRSGEGIADGRPCDSEYACEQQGKPRTTYACEKVGLFETFTEGRRVRWRGTLGDPNELALLLGALMPLAFALCSGKKGVWVAMAVAAVMGVLLWCVVLTGSRGGQLVVLTVLGVYFVRRYGVRGLLIGAILALPVLLFGGRAGEEAESSSLERIDLLYEGMDMIRSYPVLGVGVNQFMDHVYGAMTAHNSYVLAAAELGMPGCLLWTTLVYSSVKIPWVLALRSTRDLDARLRPLAVALVVSFLGILVGIFFLSFCYKAVLFVYFGLSGALYGAAKGECPALDIRVSLKEVARVAALDVVVLALVLFYSRFEAAHA